MVGANAKLWRYCLVPNFAGSLVKEKGYECLCQIP